MPITEEGDSGIETMSSPASRESSPTLKKDIVAELSSSGDVRGITEDDDEDIDETLSERLWGLTEMFPESIRNITSTMAKGSVSGVKSLYSFSRSAMWILFSSSTLLVAPIIFEAERMQMEEVARQQQRQILLGPSASVSGSGAPSLGMPVPIPQQVMPPQR